MLKLRGLLVINRDAPLKSQSYHRRLTDLSNYKELLFRLIYTRSIAPIIRSKRNVKQ